MKLWFMFTPTLSSGSCPVLKEASEDKRLMSVHIRKYLYMLLGENIFLDLNYRLFLLLFKNPEVLSISSIASGTLFQVQ